MRIFILDKLKSAITFHQYINNDKMATNIISIVTNTLNPSLLQSSQLEIQRIRGEEGFATQLMVIADNSSIDLSIRQSSLVILKHLVEDDCLKGNIMHCSDREVLKTNILQFLGRTWGENKLTGTIRQIIHVLAQKYYPSNWTNLLPAVINNIENPTDFNSVASSVEALKAVVSVFGRSPDFEVTTNSLCNVMFVPVFNLANQLFSNYKEETQPILISIFKIFNLAIFYHMPVVLINNIHELMIFCKKILDLDAKNLHPLKIVILKILARLYSRHATSNVSYKLINFALNFHNRYSERMLETFIAQLINPNTQLEIINLSIKCITCIHRNHEHSAEIINSHRRKLVNLCMQRFRVSGELKSGQSIGNFITCLKEERIHLSDFLSVLFNSNEEILSDLIENLNSGDEKTQEVVLYAFGNLSQEIQPTTHLHQNMVDFISSYVLPVFSGNSSSMLKARGCQVISAYPFLNLHGDCLQPIFQFLYSCLTTAKDPYLNIYALQAFTHLIVKYEEFQKLIIPYLANILKVYTELMKQSNGEVFEVIKSFQTFLGNLNGQDIQPYISDLIKFLIDLFDEYSQISKQQVKQEEDSEDEEEDEYNACSGCIACIRQILSVQNFPQHVFEQIQNSSILPLIINLLSDKELPHFEEALNILNLLIYKREGGLSQNYLQFFQICAYAILGIPQEMGNVNISQKLKCILVNVCVDRDDDIVSNVVGLLRNFVARFKGNLRNLKDEIGVSYMEYLFKIVDFVHNSKNQEGKWEFKESDRWIIFTIYSSLLEYQALNPLQLNLLIDNSINYYQNAQSAQVGGRANMLLQVLIFGIHYCPKVILQKLNVSWFLQQILQRWHSFSYEYEIQRLIIGIAKMMEMQLLNEEGLAREIIGRLPDLVLQFLTLKDKQMNGKGEAQLMDAEEEAEEELIAQNTHLGLRNDQVNESELLRDEKLREYDEREWDEEYNKYYYSPFQEIDQLTFLKNVLANSPYTNLLSGSEQVRLSGYLEKPI